MLYTRGFHAPILVLGPSAHEINGLEKACIKDMPKSIRLSNSTTGGFYEFTAAIFTGSRTDISFRAQKKTAVGFPQRSTICNTIVLFITDTNKILVYGGYVYNELVWEISNTTGVTVI